MVQSVETPTDIADVYLHQTASFHQGDTNVFSHSRAGSQCTAMSAVACIMIPTTVELISKQYLDNILLQGDTYYRQFIERGVGSSLLNTDELLKSVHIDDYIAVINIEDISFARFKKQNLCKELVQKII